MFEQLEERETRAERTRERIVQGKKLVDPWPYRFS